MFRQKAVRYLFSISYGNPKWSITNDEKFIREAYEQIVWVYSCVSMIASSVANVDWLLYRKIGKEIEEIDNHAMLDLLNTKVNDNMSSRDFFDLWATYLALNGKFFAVFDSPINPNIIEPLIPYYTKVIPNKEEFISGVEYRIGGDKTDYSKNLLLWSRFYDPLDLYEGLSPIKALARTLDTENSAIDWNKNSLDNSGIPPGALSLMSPTPDQIEGVKSRWVENYAGKNNVRTPLILDAEKASYTNFGITQVDMDFVLGRKLNKIEICSGFGVPGQVVGDPEGQTYANYEEAVKAFWKNTVIPKYLNHIKSNLNINLLPKFLGTQNMYLDYDLDGVDVLNEDQNILTDRILNMYNADFLTLNEGRERLGYEALEYGDNLKSKVMSEMLVDDTNGETGDLQIENNLPFNDNQDNKNEENTNKEAQNQDDKLEVIE
jgi:HK97 family phage portal protein